MAGYRPPYTIEEDRKIVRYIIENKLFCCLRGNECWKSMEAEGVVNRTWQSAKERFRKQIFNMLSNPALGISEQERKSIIDGYRATSMETNSSNITQQSSETSRPIDLTDMIFDSSDEET